MTAYPGQMSPMGAMPQFRSPFNQGPTMGPPGVTYGQPPPAQGGGGPPPQQPPMAGPGGPPQQSPYVGQAMAAMQPGQGMGAPQAPHPGQPMGGLQSLSGMLPHMGGGGGGGGAPGQPGQQQGWANSPLGAALMQKMGLGNSAHPPAGQAPYQFGGPVGAAVGGAASGGLHTIGDIFQQMRGGPAGVTRQF